MAKNFEDNLAQIKQICDIHQKITTAMSADNKTTEKTIIPLMANDFLNKIDDIIISRNLYFLRKDLIDKYSKNFKGSLVARQKRVKDCFRKMLKEIEKTGMITLGKIDRSTEIININFDPYYLFLDLMNSRNFNITIDNRLFLSYPMIQKKEITETVIDRIVFLLHKLNPHIITYTINEIEPKPPIDVTYISINKTRVIEYPSNVSKKTRILQGTERRFQLGEDQLFSLLSDKIIALVNDYRLNQTNDQAVSIYDYFDNLITNQDSNESGKNIILYNYLSNVKSVRDLDYYLKHNIFYDKYNKMNGITKFYQKIFNKKQNETYFIGIAKNPSSGMLMREKLFYDDEIIKEYRLPGLFWTDAEIMKLIIPSGTMIGPLRTQKINMNPERQRLLLNILNDLRNSLSKNSDYIDNLIFLTRKEKTNFSTISYLIDNMELEMAHPFNFDRLKEVYFDKLESKVYFVRVDDEIYSLNVKNYTRLPIGFMIKRPNDEENKIEFSIRNKIIYNMESKLIYQKENIFNFLKSV